MTLPFAPIGIEAPVENLWTKNSFLHDIRAISTDVAAELTSSKTPRPFCLWLSGPLGAGKTTLVAAILRELGLNPLIPVTSPTYSYMNEYQIGDNWFAHLDLYRIGEGLHSEDLGLADARPYRGYFVEWPQLKADDPYLQATHVLAIEFGPTADQRICSLSKVS